jgi:hypothetical protein
MRSFIIQAIAAIALAGTAYARCPDGSECSVQGNYLLMQMPQPNPFGISDRVVAVYSDHGFNRSTAYYHAIAILRLNKLSQETIERMKGQCFWWQNNANSCGPYLHVSNVQNLQEPIDGITVIATLDSVNDNQVIREVQDKARAWQREHPQTCNPSTGCRY